MSFQNWQPSKILKPYIRHFAISRSESPQTYQVLPDTALVIGFQFRGRLSHIENNFEQPLNSGGITGLLDQYRIFKNIGETSSVLIVFTETGAAYFLKNPLHELFGQSLSLEHFFNQSDIKEIQEKLEAAEADRVRLELVEDFLLRHIKERKEDLMVAGAVHHIYQSKGTIRIAALAQILNTSESPLEKRFRTLVGASPKKFAGIVRSRHILESLKNKDEDAAEHLSSYYDQAHFIKDFKKFSSMTPDQYLRSIRDQNK